MPAPIFSRPLPKVPAIPPPTRMWDRAPFWLVGSGLKTMPGEKHPRDVRTWAGHCIVCGELFTFTVSADEEKPRRKCGNHRPGVRSWRAESC